MADAPGTLPITVEGTIGGALVYAIGDIHGCYELLRELLRAIETDISTQRGEGKATLIFCGDYVDRGPDSSRVLDALCWLKRHAPHDVRFLRGNHDAVMLDYIRDPAPHRDWMRFGGAETLRAYGVTPPNADDPVEHHRRTRDDLLERMPVAHLRLLEELDPMLTIGDFVFVHAGIRPGRALSAQSEADLLWIRDEFLSSTATHEKIVVHGHTWTASKPVVLPHRIAVDTGAYATGVLAAVRLRDRAAAVISVGRDRRLSDRIPIDSTAEQVTSAPPA
jgi:serine/threonine protein phosphatase 1